MIDRIIIYLHAPELLLCDMGWHRWSRTSMLKIGMWKHEQCMDCGKCRRIK